MKRVMRWAWNVLTALSLLLCVAACVLWVRSYRVGSSFGYYASARPGPLYPDVWASSYRGRLGFVYFYQDTPGGRVPRGRFYFHQFPAAGGRDYRLPWQRYGFGYQREHRFDMGWRQAVVPHGFACVLFAAVPLGRAGRLGARRLRARRRSTCGHCPACGYDLRATPGRCPECGAVPAR